MIIAKFSVWKMIKGLGPPLLASATLIFLITPPVFQMLSGGIVERYLFSGLVALLLSFVMLIYIGRIIIIVAINRLKGIYFQDKSIIFFDGSYIQWNISSIKSVELQQRPIGGRRVIISNSGSLHRSILSNLMDADEEEIKKKIMDIVSSRAEVIRV